MGLLELVFLFVIGIVGGIITTVVGGASIVTLPALIAVGLPPVPAVVVNIVSLVPANLSAAWWDRTKLPPPTRPMLIVYAISCAGALFGAWLLLLTPARLFDTLIPLLLGLSTALFAYAGRLAQWIDRRARDEAAAEQGRWTVAIAAMVPVSIYGGYFGAGAGVMLLAILMIVASGDYRIANAIKNLISGIHCLVAGAIFTAQSAVAWKPSLVVTVGGVLGALVGMKIIRAVPREAMRRSVIGTGIFITLVFAWRYWL